MSIRPPSTWGRAPEDACLSKPRVYPAANGRIIYIQLIEDHDVAGYLEENIAILRVQVRLTPGELVARLRMRAVTRLDWDIETARCKYEAHVAMWIPPNSVFIRVAYRCTTPDVPAVLSMLWALNPSVEYEAWNQGPLTRWSWPREEDRHGQPHPERRSRREDGDGVVQPEVQAEGRETVQPDEQEGTGGSPCLPPGVEGHNR